MNPEAIKEAAQHLLDDMREHFQDVILLPAPEPKHHTHMIRGAINSNPAWYSELFEREGYVRRKTVEMVLERLSRTGTYLNRSYYEGLLRPIIDELIEETEEAPF